MRVVLITSKLNFLTAGGSVADLHLKAKGLKNLGHEVKVVTAFSRANKINQSLPYELAEENINSGKLLNIQRGVYKILKKYETEADIFYIDGHIFLYGGGLYRILGGKKPIVAFFNIRLNCWGDTQGNIINPPFLKRVKKKIRYWLEHFIGVRIANHLDAFIFNTPMVEDLYVKWGFDKNKSNIVEDFVDTSAIAESVEMTATENIEQNTAEPIIFLTSGRMIAEKGFDLVIKAFAKLSNKENFKLIMTGSGPEHEKLLQLVQILELENYISLPGWVEKEELNSLFLKAHIFIFPKWWIEYGSAVLTEAMAYKMPVIVPTGGALEWLSDGAALTFVSDSTESLAEQMERLGNNFELRASLAKGSSTRIADLDCLLLTKKIESILQSALHLENKRY